MKIIAHCLPDAARRVGCLIKGVWDTAELKAKQSLLDDDTRVGDHSFVITAGLAGIGVSYQAS